MLGYCHLLVNSNPLNLFLAILYTSICKKIIGMYLNHYTIDIVQKTVKKKNKINWKM